MPQSQVCWLAQLPEDAAQHPCPTLIDTNAIEATLRWLEDNVDDGLRSLYGLWQFAVLEEQAKAKHLDEWYRVSQRLKALDIKIVKGAKLDRALVAEMQHAYFGDDPAGHDAAELLAYGRRRAGNQQKVRILSAYYPFQLVPHTQVVVLPTMSTVSSQADHAYYRALEALKLHQMVMDVADDYMRNRDYPVAINQTINAYYDELKKICNYPTDGWELLEKAFNSLDNKTPIVHLNSLSDKHERGEQQGYYHLGCGVQAAARNMLSHHGPNSSFTHQHFDDRGTTLKWLCLLSLLFEKLDKRVAPK